MLNVVLFGAPGCGKGTQSELLEKKFGLSHISTGEIIRSHIKSQTELGKQMQEYISRGELAPDSVVIGMVEDYLGQNKGIKGTIFDGFPRTVKQAEILEDLFSRYELQLDGVVSLEVPEDVLIERMLERGKTSGRADDNIESIHYRFVEYDSKTKPVLDFYQHRNCLHPINGVGTIEEIFENICETIDSIHNS